MKEQGAGTALITGASSGIGETFARRLASMGYDVVLVARRMERLERLAGELAQRHGVVAQPLVADLATDGGVALVEERLGQLPHLAMLVNNAGFGTTGRFFKVDVAKSMAMIALHVAAPTRLTHAALSGMVARRRGAVINVASPSAFVLLPGNLVYSATKHYLITFSEGLALELRGSGVQIQALCPGFTHTGFHDTEEFRRARVKSLPSFMWTSAEEVVEGSLDALGRGPVVFVPGLVNRLLYVRMRGLAAFLARRVLR